MTPTRPGAAVAPAWRAYHPPEVSGPEPVADPWPQLPDDTELWSAVPPLFTTDRLARLDKEQAGA
ncbi:hypothetical protein HDA40_006500 [Hamadaea flava]|uniref:Uncharacterized protein n=1 Tax=Hamadaea flava TaxID=1742688 RepID=A0ABV8LVA6_9ACTN|nr:hypothetical protein [Hamadaea flava]MCP2327993.1 hypothetical protein [Hamadaea flava]